MMSDPDSLRNHRLERLQLFLYLVPVLGFFPALWALYRGKGSREQQRVSRLAVTLALLWLLAYCLLGWEVGQTAGLLKLRLGVLNSLLTSGYFVVCVALMMRLWQKKSLRLPGISSLAQGIIYRRLSK